MRYEMTIILTVEADSRDAAVELGAGAIQHLQETFNDDDSILDGEVRTAVQVHP